MRFSPKTSAFFGLLLALTLAGKGLTNRPAFGSDEAPFVKSAMALLREEGFTVRPERRPRGMVVYGRKGDCTMMVRDYSPYGTLANIYASAGQAIGPLHYVYRGAIYERAPKLVPMMEFYLHRELARVGLAVPRAPILAVAAKPNCVLSSVRWSEIAMLPR